MTSTVRDLEVWEKNHLEECQKTNLFKNKDILEIGGHTPREHIERFGFKSWVCVDLSIPNICEKPDYSWRNGDIRNTNLPSDSFDTIIATHSFEHINNLDISLSNCFRMLKSGGFLSSLYGPLWSCHNGSHINGIIDKSGNMIRFNEADVIPKWAHLLYSKEELRELLSSTYEQEYIERILFQTYESQNINRLFYEDYIDIINNSGFKILEIRNWHSPIYPDETTQRILEEKYNKKNFGTISTKILLQKP